MQKGARNDAEHNKKMEPEESKKKKRVCNNRSVIKENMTK